MARIRPEIPLKTAVYRGGGLSYDDVFQETSARYRAVKPEQWLQRHPEAGSSWPSWPQASQGGYLILEADGVHGVGLKHLLPSSLRLRPQKVDASQHLPAS